MLDKDILNAMRREFPLAIDALKKSSTILNRFWNDQKGFAENCLNELHLLLVISVKRSTYVITKIIVDTTRAR